MKVVITTLNPVLKNTGFFLGILLDITLEITLKITLEKTPKRTIEREYMEENLTMPLLHLGGMKVVITTLNPVFTDTYKVWTSRGRGAHIKMIWNKFVMEKCFSELAGLPFVLYSERQ